MTATVNQSPAPATAVARVYAGACADVDVTTGPLHEGDGLGAAGTETGTLPLGDYCVVVDTSYVGGEDFDVEGELDIVIGIGTNPALVEIVTVP